MDPTVPDGQARDDDAEAVTALLGRRPEGRFEVVVRDGDGVPAVGVGQLGRLTGLFGGPDAAAGFQGADP